MKVFLVKYYDEDEDNWKDYAIYYDLAAAQACVSYLIEEEETTREDYIIYQFEVMSWQH